MSKFHAAYYHPKFLALESGAVALYFYGLSYVADKETDGFISKQQVPVLGMMFGVSSVKSIRLASILVERNLWELLNYGYQIHDYLDYNKSALQLKTLRAKTAKRVSLFRNTELMNFIKNRDRDLCQYCGVSVVWGTHGQNGGTFDHLDPNGLNTANNLVVACRACNSSKNDGCSVSSRVTREMISDLYLKIKDSVL